MPSGRRSAKRPYGTEHVPVDVERVRGGRSSESGPDGSWTVQRVGGSDRTYRCPGCDQEIRPSLPHLVAWRPGAEGDRRHWHTPCWAARNRRAPVVQRGRSAPRY